MVIDGVVNRLVDVRRLATAWAIIELGGCWMLDVGGRRGKVVGLCDVLEIFDDRVAKRGC